MSPEEFRQFGHQAIDWIADYLAHPERYPVLPRVRPGEIADALPGAAPESGEPMERILEDFRELIVPGVTHWNHPAFMAYFATSASGPGILGELLTAALDVNGMVWKSSPAATELEQVTLDWLRQWLGLPEGWFGIIHDTASTATMHAIAAAREAADPGTRDRGAAPGLVVYASEHAHSSIEKGAMSLGVGRANVRLIKTDEQFRMCPAALEEAIARDRAAGLRPFFVCATAGTTSTTSIDPIPAIAEIAARERLWLHVDAAFGGAAAIVPEFRHVLAGAERADSLVMNPHKWLFTPVDLSAFYTRHPDVLRRAFSLLPEYLRTAEDPRAVNFMEYGVPLGRRFRALKLWFVMRYYGREGAAAVIRLHIECAQELAAAISADPRFELAAPAPLSLVCFRLRGGDALNQQLLDRVNAGGRVFLSHTVLGGRMTLRVAIGNVRTTRETVRMAWHTISEEAERLEAS